jgi:hypothetical protein
MHSAAPPWDSARAEAQLAKLSHGLTEYNQNIAPIIASINRFRSGLNAHQVMVAIHALESDLATLRIKRRRIESDAACRNYSQALDRKRRLEEENARLQQELEQEQSNFLNRYFGVINETFSALGSGRFTIAMETSRRGNMPTVQIRASFGNVEVTPDRLHAFFSESDRRALALAVFWAKLELLEDTEKERSIVVLDDPVTSFDDARIDRTIRLIEAGLPKLRQVIVFSHYAVYLETFFKRLRGRPAFPLLLAKLFQNENGSQVACAEPMDFVETPHQRAYRRITDFIERRHREDIFQDLRVFLETEVHSRYYSQILANELREKQFVDLLDELLRVNAFEQNVRSEIEQLRITLNTDHHVWTNRSLEEKIGIATDVVRFIYERL